MALGVHRCRFVGWSPSPITALALPPPHKSHNLPFPPLAVGRQNGSIELYRWAAKGSSPHTLPGPADTKVDALALTIRARRQPHQHYLRLFSLPGDANLYEWDIQSGTVLVRIYQTPIHSHPAQSAVGYHHIWSCPYFFTFLSFFPPPKLCDTSIAPLKLILTPRVAYNSITGRYHLVPCS
ncbi:hypothetical protein AG1IA_01474 [Rhizoctonia solani AG-1 IA]|uniref:WD40 domain-containing protein n=1 Tax=Thanatephorus cucumeris (strain AG1-IA) TaxID=983506 RepID=L8X5Y5_THACA|nr:hypothetical protein AG1IA_01474 [Rhizoctonia solani AG-1 IA]